MSHNMAQQDQASKCSWGPHLAKVFKAVQILSFSFRFKGRVKVKQVK